MPSKAGRNNSEEVLEVLFELSVKSRNLPPDVIIEQQEKLDWLRGIMAELERKDQRAALVIDLYFGLTEGLPLTLEEIGKRISLTREGVRQIKEKAIKKLKAMVRFQEFIAKNKMPY